jgi:hypothetical protein
LPGLFAQKRVDDLQNFIDGERRATLGVQRGLIGLVPLVAKVKIIAFLGCFQPIVVTCVTCALVSYPVLGVPMLLVIGVSRPDLFNLVFLPKLRPP